MTGGRFSRSSRGIEASNQALSCGLLIAGGPIYLAGEIEPFHVVNSQGRVQDTGIDMIIFYCIARLRISAR
jgi:hypothetical protein